MITRELIEQWRIAATAVTEPNDPDYRHEIVNLHVFAELAAAHGQAQEIGSLKTQLLVAEGARDMLNRMDDEQAQEIERLKEALAAFIHYDTETEDDGLVMMLNYNKAITLARAAIEAVRK